MIPIRHIEKGSQGKAGGLFCEEAAFKKLSEMFVDFFVNISLKGD